ncbi:hypothetical protein OSTOST_09416 [Ostertagia ostertagi]
MEAQTAKDKDALTFEREMRNKLAYLEQLITDSKDSVMSAIKTETLSPSHGHLQLNVVHQGSGDEEIRGVRGENDIIEGNANFMEGVDEPDEAEDVETDEEADAEKNSPKQKSKSPTRKKSSKRLEEEIAEEEIGEADVEEPDEEENFEAENEGADEGHIHERQ